jgi:hypothetical protein
MIAMDDGVMLVRGDIVDRPSLGREAGVKLVECLGTTEPIKAT